MSKTRLGRVAQVSPLDSLYKSVRARWRPEDVAREILVAEVAAPSGMLSEKSLSHLKRVSRGNRYSSMSTEFRGAADMSHLLQVARELFPMIKQPEEFEVAAIKVYIDKLGSAVYLGDNDFKSRLNRKDRTKKRKLPWKGHRAFNKRCRLVVRLMERFENWQGVAELTDLAQVAKTRLANQIPIEAFKSNAISAYFTAYMTAKLGLRSQFTWGSQVKSFDQIAESLFGDCVALSSRSSVPNWFAIAHVYPVPEVLDFLSEAEKGSLLGSWFDVMERSSRILSGLAAKGGYDLVKLIVKRGNDSSSWNESAGAFNKGREGWINTLNSLGAGEVLDKFCPGKALRLMAADVVAMHRSYGSGDLDPDTKVWQKLPFPWLVMEGSASCTRREIEAICTRVGIMGKGWTAPRLTTVAKFEPTPELVYGVTVSSPELASVLRRAGYFSGPSKGAKAMTGIAVSKALGKDGKHVVVSGDAPEQEVSSRRQRLKKIWDKSQIAAYMSKL